uniref:Uncharacterized protein n=1 Tax=Glossina brevipalpis TaxID=37001 RepID=A0A1A9WUU4_9MUSC
MILCALQCNILQLQSKGFIDDRNEHFLAQSDECGINDLPLSTNVRIMIPGEAKLRPSLIAFFTITFDTFNLLVKAYFPVDKTTWLQNQGENVDYNIRPYIKNMKLLLLCGEHLFAFYGFGANYVVMKIYGEM